MKPLPAGKGKPEDAEMRRFLARGQAPRIGARRVIQACLGVQLLI